MNEGILRSIIPQNIGWLEYRLTKIQLNYIWECIHNNKKESLNSDLAGNLSSSVVLKDTKDWFYNNCIVDLIGAYRKLFVNLADGVPVRNNQSFYIKDWWVNYQKQTEFNPIHSHTGVYSFVIFMKIPIDFEEQNKGNESNAPVKSSFQFCYSDMLGKFNTYTYKLKSEDEGLMLFFPSELNHQVYPFYDCDEERITVAGNVLIDTDVPQPSFRSLYNSK